MKKLILIILMILQITSCTDITSNNEKEDPTLQEARLEIKNSNTLYWQAFSKGDPNLFINRYASDACIMAPNAASMCGKDAAKLFFQIAYDSMAVRDGKFTTTELYGMGNYVAENGLFELRDANDGIIDNGKYLVLWKKTDQGWKMYRDSFSSNNPIY
ncbi:YybH family protein [Fulvivirga ligni]|uniref:YybH family protein n=1 Tax=Fulvivirga ligni TaxID=2904246 RepID=UPI001F1EA12E|nr:nuclear transport factor 2 family protein [Fulvivirga ligni]UII21715.1 nuclear transport factor 2 family protein [Fulvivirga ligni]